MWKLGEIHEVYGKVIMMGNLQGEAYRWFENKHGTISMIPLSALIEQTQTKAG